MFGWLFPKKRLSRELQALAVLVERGSLLRETPIYGYELTFVVRLDGGRVTFKYNAIRRRFYGFLEFWMGEHLMLRPFSHDSEYWEALGIVKNRFGAELSSLVDEFYVQYVESRKKISEDKQRLLSGVLGSRP